jgi:hypothetical protein
MVLGGQRHAPASLASGKKPVTHFMYRRVGVLNGPSDLENLTFAGIRSLELSRP